MRLSVSSLICFFFFFSAVRIGNRATLQDRMHLSIVLRVAEERAYAFYFFARTFTLIETADWFISSLCCCGDVHFDITVKPAMFSSWPIGVYIVSTIKKHSLFFFQPPSHVFFFFCFSLLFLSFFVVVVLFFFSGACAQGSIGSWLLSPVAEPSIARRRTWEKVHTPRKRRKKKRKTVSKRWSLGVWKQQLL